MVTRHTARILPRICTPSAALPLFFLLSISWPWRWVRFFWAPIFSAFRCKPCDSSTVAINCALCGQRHLVLHADREAERCGQKAFVRVESSMLASALRPEPRSTRTLAMVGKMADPEDVQRIEHSGTRMHCSPFPPDYSSACVIVKGDYMFGLVKTCELTPGAHFICQMLRDPRHRSSSRSGWARSPDYATYCTVDCRSGFSGVR